MLGGGQKNKAVQLLMERYSTDEMETEEVVELAYQYGKKLAELPQDFKTEHLTAAEKCSDEHGRWHGDYKDWAKKEISLQSKVKMKMLPKLTGAAKRFWQSYEKLRKQRKKFRNAKPDNLIGRDEIVFGALSEVGAFSPSDAQNILEGCEILERMWSARGTYGFWLGVGPAERQEYDIL